MCIRDRPPDDIRYLEIAIDFYARLNELTDDELEAADYSRQEIEEGPVSYTHLDVYKRQIKRPISALITNNT